MCVNAWASVSTMRCAKMEGGLPVAPRGLRTAAAMSRGPQAQLPDVWRLIGRTASRGGGGGGRLAPPGRTWRFLTQSCLMLPQPLKTKSSQELYVLTLVQSLLFFMVSSTWLSEELTVSVAVQCMSGRVSKQNITLDSDTEWFG